MDDPFWHERTGVARNPQGIVAASPILTIKSIDDGREDKPVHRKGRKVMRPTRAMKVLMASQPKMNAKMRPVAKQGDILYRKQGPRFQGDHSQWRRT